EVEIEAIALEVARQLEQMAVSRSVEIRVARGLPKIVVDAARLELILVNLVSNAIKYSDDRKVPSYVEIGPESTVDGLCTFAVRDNGLGIPETDQADVFERFFRAHTDLDEQLGVTGSGLGLSIVAECIEALKGSIRVESTPGTGTTFHVSVPCEPART